MPQPKKRHSSSRQGKRRSNWKLELPSLSTCPNCQAPVLPHYACSQCGTYQGREVIKIGEKKDKKPKKGE